MNASTQKPPAGAVSPACKSGVGHQGSTVAGACTGTVNLNRKLLDAADARWELDPCTCPCHPGGGRP